MLPRRATFALLSLVCAISLLHGRLFETANGPLAVFLTVFFAFTIYMSMWAWNIVLRLDDARKTERELALTHERLRFANELHGAQGHTLQVLALKTELAERLLDADPEAAREQLRDARQLAADALANTRSIARGYQRVSLEDELANAVDVLEAAGTVCELRIEENPAEDAKRELIARLVREGTTNLLRHATAATRATIEVTAKPNRWVVRMRNNGVEESNVERGETKTVASVDAVGTSTTNSY